MEPAQVKLKGSSVFNLKSVTIPKLMRTQDDCCEVVIGLVGAVGTNLGNIAQFIAERICLYGYTPNIIRVSDDIIQPIAGINNSAINGEANRIITYMNAGDELRKKQEDILSYAIASKILNSREREQDDFKPMPKHAYIISSLKHPSEVKKLREIYKNGFYLLGVFCEEKQRKLYLSRKGVSEEEAQSIMERDEHQDNNGQQTRDTFQISDFFLSYDNGNVNIAYNSIERILDLIFGNPFITPTFGEYAMYMAYANSLRSADLSRQIGAVITKDNQIIASGTNDCPKAGGGLYWPILNEEGIVSDYQNGRDYTRGFDSNKKQLLKIVDQIFALLSIEKTENNEKALFENSLLSDLTEYGRIVHAEMEAIIMCARTTISSLGTEMYCTTFPCHNCAKHIVAAGISKVYLIEPYPKSKAPEFYSDCIKITQSQNKDAEKVIFSHFIGVGPRRFNELFSLKPSDGRAIMRKNSRGDAEKWHPKRGKLRQQMLPYTYIDREIFANGKLWELLNKREAADYDGGESSKPDVTGGETKGDL